MQVDNKIATCQNKCKQEKQSIRLIGVSIPIAGLLPAAGPPGRSPDLGARRGGGPAVRPQGGCAAQTFGDGHTQNPDEAKILASPDRNLESILQSRLSAPAW